MEDPAPEFFSSSGYWGSLSGPNVEQSPESVQAYESSVKVEHSPSEESPKASETTTQAGASPIVQVGVSPIQSPCVTAPATTKYILFAGI